MQHLQWHLPWRLAFVQAAAWFLGHFGVPAGRCSVRLPVLRNQRGPPSEEVEAAWNVDSLERTVVPEAAKEIGSKTDRSQQCPEIPRTLV